MSEYYGVQRSEEYLSHYGVLGMKWGVRKDHPSSGQTLFVSGSSKTQDKSSPYYRRKLPKYVKQQLKYSMKNRDKIIVGDAPGIDRQVQDYLKKKRYPDVEVYGPGKKVRYNANSKWKTNPIDAPEYPEGSSEWLAKKDKAMSDRATKGLAVILDEGSRATRKNVARMIANNKHTSIYELSGKGPRPLIKGFNPGGDQQIIYWGVHDPKRKIGEGWNIGGHNYAIQYRGLVDYKTRNKL
jgi:hypothetical protein